MAGDLRSPLGDIPPSHGHHLLASGLPPGRAKLNGGEREGLRRPRRQLPLSLPVLAKVGLRGAHGTSSFISHLWEWLMVTPSTGLLPGGAARGRTPMTLSEKFPTV